MEALSDILLSALLFIITLSLIFMMSAIRSSTKRINDRNEENNKKLISILSEIKKSNEDVNKNVISTLNELKSEIISANKELIDTLNEVTKID